MKREKQPRLSGIQGGIAGEYLVGAELSRRGYVASLTLRNTRGIDILASNRDATKSVGIQVKTSQRTTADWVMSKKAEHDLAENLYYVFVTLPQQGPARFHVVPRKVVGRYVRDSHARWLETPGKQGRPHRDTDMRVFSDRGNEYKDRWDLLGLEEVSEPDFQRRNVVSVPLTEAEHQAVQGAAAVRSLDEGALLHEWVRDKLRQAS